MVMLDPFSEIQGKIEEILSEHVPLSQLVPPGNQVEDGEPKTIVKDGDMGEWRVIPYSGGGVEFRATSSASRIVQNYAIGIATTNRNARAFYFPLKFQIIAAFDNAIAAETESLGLSYLVSFRLLDLVDSNTGNAATGEDLDRGMDGWVGLIIFSAMMMMAPSEIRSRALSIATTRS